MPKLPNELKTSPEGYRTPPGTDPVLDLMRETQVPLTRENYLALADLQEPLGAELEAEVPKEFQRWDFLKPSVSRLNNEPQQ